MVAAGGLVPHVVSDLTVRRSTTVPVVVDQAGGVPEDAPVVRDVRIPGTHGVPHPGVIDDFAKLQTVQSA